MPIAIRDTADGPGEVGQGLGHGSGASLASDDAASELKKIIADVIQVDLDDLDDTQSFLKLGGDSILAIKIMARCRAKGISLDIADMIDARSIADACRRVSKSVPTALSKGSETFRQTEDDIPLVFQDESTKVGSCEVTGSIDGQDVSNSLHTHKTVHQQELGVGGYGFIENIPMSILLGTLSTDGSHLEPLGFIHSALVTAASVTTSSNVEDILFYDICEATLENKTSAQNSAYTISQSRSRSFPCEDDARLLGRQNARNHIGSSYDDETVTRQAPYVSSSGSGSENNIISVDVRQLKQQTGEEKRPVGPISQDFLLDVKGNLNDSSHLSLTLSPIDNGISCSFEANSLWQAHYDLDDFIKTFISSIKGMLKRHLKYGSRTALRHSGEVQSTRISGDHMTSNDVPETQSRTASLNALDVNVLKHILRPEARTISSVLPCSPMQEAFLTSQSTNPSLYQCCFVLELTSTKPGLPIDARHVGACWREVVKRHTILRTIFVDSSTRLGHYDQVVVDNLDPHIEYIESLSPTGFSALAPVDFGPFEPPHRMYLTQTSSEVVQMKLEISHTIVDGQSTEVLLRDLCTAYLGVQRSGHVLGYSDFASYLSQVPVESSPGSLFDGLSHEWTSFLPMDRGHEILTGLETVRTGIVFDSGSLQDFSDAYGVTLSNVCQLAWGLVLRCFTGSDKVSFSHITSGRSAPLEGIHDAVGPFVATLPCCLYLPSTSQVEALLKEISKNTLEGFSHRHGADIYNDSKISARELGNTSMSFQRKLDMRAVSGSPLNISVVERSNPTDVSTDIPISKRILILVTSMTLC